MTSPARRPLVVAIDGPAGAGKSTAAKRLTAILGYALLDTGALYRSVAVSARRTGVSWNDEDGLARIAAELDILFRLDGDINRVFLAGDEVTEAIRTPEASEGASLVSALPKVRSALLDLQRRLAGQGGVVAEGRDVGTVVFPAADAKFFLTASDEVRARRRVEELRARGVDADYDETLASIRTRDDRDSTRAAAPLICADDAVVVDSSALTIDQMVETMVEVVRAREGSSRS